MKLRKGDPVRILAGKDVGKDSTIMRVIPKQGRVVVEGVNRAKKHQKPTRATLQGGIIDKDMPVDASNVAMLCSTCGPTRIGYRIDDDGVKYRICKKCGGDL